MSVQAGGSATINGIIYQMLWSLLQTSSLYIKDCDYDQIEQQVSKAHLILEPKGGGGDLVFRDIAETRIQQLKADSGEGAWSLRSFVYDVLPDLYRAVKLEDKPQVFEFITEGHMGDWAQVDNFFSNLHSRPFPDSAKQALTQLNSQDKIRFRGSLDKTGTNTFSELTERDIFEKIIAILRLKGATKSQEDDLIYRQVWYLLSRLSYRWDQTKDSLHKKIRFRLSAFVDDIDLLDNNLRVLLTALAEEAISGNAPIYAEEFLYKYGFKAIPLNLWSKILNSSNELLHSSMSAMHYDFNEDVRPIFDLINLSYWNSADSRFLVLTGESGQGKTWQLCSLANSIAQQVPVILLSATEDGQRDIDQATQRFWHGICNHQNHATLESLSKRIRESVSQHDGHWLSIFIDNVQGLKEAYRIYELTASIPGICVAMTMPEEVADSFKAYAQNKALLIKIRDFTELELQQYLVGTNLNLWHDIPEDVRGIIQRPLLANIYRQLSQDGHWEPTNEYDLFSEYFQTRYLKPLQSQIRFGPLHLKSALLKVWTEQLYPWNLDQLNTFGVHEATLDILIRLGWIILDDSDKYHIWHDRLLSWHIAETLAASLHNRDLTPESVGKRCAEVLWHKRDKSLFALRYVPMDLIWLLARRGDADAIIDIIINELDREWSTEDELYGFLLPTIGNNIASALFRRLKHISEDEVQFGSKQIISALSDFDADIVCPLAIELLASENAFLRKAGINIITKRPHADALDILWTRYCEVYHSEKKSAETADGDSNYDIWEQMELWSAFEACVGLYPEWLERTIVHAQQGKHSIGALAAFLRNIPNGISYWTRLKNTVRAKLEPNEERHFALAAYHYADAEEVEWLSQRVASTVDGLAPCCVKALVRIAPDLLISQLGDFLAEELYLTRKWTFADIYGRSPDEMREAIYFLISERPNEIWDYAEAFNDLPDAMNDAILDLCLDSLSGELEAGYLDTLWRKYRNIAGINSLSLLDCIIKRSGTEWEQRFVDLVINRGSLPGYVHNVQIEDALNILYKMGGDGYTQVINYWLQSDEPYARMHGIKYAFKRPDDKTIKLLLSIIFSQERDGIAKHLPYMAQQSLAHIGAWKCTVDSIVHMKEQSNRFVLSSREETYPLSDEDMEAAIVALGTNPNHQSAIIALGFGKRTDYIPRIVNILAEQNPKLSNATTNACLWALHVMPEIPPDVVEVLIPRLACSDGRWVVLNILVREGSARSALAILEYLRTTLFLSMQSGTSVGDIHDLVIRARYVLQHEATKEEAVLLCRDRIALEGNSLSYIVRNLIQVLVPYSSENVYFQRVLDSEPVRQFLAHDAFQSIDGNKIHSIHGLATFKNEEAYIAALRVLKHADSGERKIIPYTLTKLNRVRAIEDILNHLTTERDAIVREACGRALCRANCTDILLERLKSIRIDHRSALIFVLGFANPDSELIDIIRQNLNDDHVYVYEDSLKAIHRLNRAHSVKELINRFQQETEVVRRWILLDAILETGDLGGENEPYPEWLSELCFGLPPLTIKYVEEKAKKLREKYGRNIEREGSIFGV